jgi:hypothetical protein
MIGSRAVTPKPTGVKMRASLFLLTCAVVLLPGYATRASVILGPVVNPQNGHSYYLLSQENWTVAENEALTLGGTLATIRSAAENTFVSTTFGVNRNLWFGLYDPVMDNLQNGQHAANFVWVSGDPSSYRNWAPPEPNNVNGHNEWYGFMWGFTSDINADPSNRPLSSWNDVSDDPGSGVNQGYGVVEVVPEPCILGLTSSIAFFSFRRTRRHRIA